MNGQHSARAGHAFTPRAERQRLPAASRAELSCDTDGDEPVAHTWRIRRPSRVRFERSVPSFVLLSSVTFPARSAPLRRGFNVFGAATKIASVGTTRIAQERRSAGAWSNRRPHQNVSLRVAPIALLTPFLVVTLACERASRSPDALSAGAGAQEQGGVHQPNYC